MNSEKKVLVHSINEFYEKSAFTSDIFFLKIHFLLIKFARLLSRKAKYIPEGKEVGRGWGVYETTVKLQKRGFWPNDSKEF